MRLGSLFHNAFKTKIKYSGNSVTDHQSRLYTCQIGNQAISLPAEALTFHQQALLNKVTKHPRNFDLTIQYYQYGYNYHPSKLPKYKWLKVTGLKTAKNADTDKLTTKEEMLLFKLSQNHY